MICISKSFLLSFESFMYLWSFWTKWTRVPKWFVVILSSIRFSSRSWMFAQTLLSLPEASLTMTWVNFSTPVIAAPASGLVDKAIALVTSQLKARMDFWRSLWSSLAVTTRNKTNTRRQRERHLVVVPLDAGKWLLRRYKRMFDNLSPLFPGLHDIKSFELFLY